MCVRPGPNSAGNLKDSCIAPVRAFRPSASKCRLLRPRHYLKKVDRADQKALDLLEVAYISLSHFQPLTAEERDVVFLMQSLDHASDDEKIERVNKGGNFAERTANCTYRNNEFLRDAALVRD